MLLDPGLDIAVRQVEFERPPGFHLPACRVRRRRGPRSLEALRRRGECDRIRGDSLGDSREDVRCEAGSTSSLPFEVFNFEHLNIKGFLWKHIELE